MPMPNPFMMTPMSIFGASPAKNRRCSNGSAKSFRAAA